MIINILMFIMMYPVMLILYVVLLNCGKPGRGIAFGVTMKSEWFQDAEVEKITKEYYHEMKRNLIIFAVIPFSFLLISHVSIQLTLWMLWFLIALGAMEFPYIIANKKMKNLKTEKGWYHLSQREAYTEMKAAGAVRKVKIRQFLAPVLLSAAAAVSAYVYAAVFHTSLTTASIEKMLGFGKVILCMALITPLFYIAAIWMDRQKTEVISTDSDVNINYARAKKNVWKKFWMAAAWMNTVYVLVLAASLLTDTVFTVVTFWGAMAESLLLLLSGIPMVKSMKQIEAVYQEKRNFTGDAEEDSCWLGGTFYYNPKDSHTMVSKRFGIGTTVNMATPVGKGMMIIAAIALLSIPFLCGWIIVEEFTPISLSVSENTLKAYHLKADYEIPVNSIENLTLVEELPSWTKSVGTAMDTLEKGTFIVHNLGKCEVFLNPENTIFLQFDSSGTTYYMSGVNDEETMEIYHVLTNW